MKRHNRKDENKQFVLGILVGRGKDNAVSMEEIECITCFSREKIKRIIYHLTVKDRIPVALRTEFPYGFYIKKKCDEKE